VTGAAIAKSGGLIGGKVAVRAVLREPVSTEFSLLTGNFQGKSAVLGRIRAFWTIFVRFLQAFTGSYEAFPCDQNNKEKYSTIRERNQKNREVYVWKNSRWR